MNNAVVINNNFSQIREVVLKNKNELLKSRFDGMVLDLGLSSAQLDDMTRGFSFQGEAPLDMSFGPQIDNSAYYIVNTYSQSDLERIIKDYGEEPWAKKISENIIKSRRQNKISSTKELAEIIATTIPQKFWSRKIHPATKTFQALRIETNQELENLKEFLNQSLDLLESQGRLVIVSFHSLEDRIVKNYFRDWKKANLVKVLTPKPLSPSDSEIENYRSRSAKLQPLKNLIINYKYMTTSKSKI